MTVNTEHPILPIYFILHLKTKKESKDVYLIIKLNWANIDPITLLSFVFVVSLELDQHKSTACLKIQLGLR